MEIEEDLIEELGSPARLRQHSCASPTGLLAMLPQTEQARPLARVRQIVADCGYQEVVNFAFVEEAWERILPPTTSRFAWPTRSPAS
jgi:phenylalanyl-tRNA synthetase beta chain